MIRELTVENLAIIERSQIALGPGFTVLTGETGAGKSLLIDAIELALGERADADLVRSGARSAIVHAVFEPELTIDREVFAEGRSVSRINGKTAPAAQLRQLGATLVDLHGQHDHQSLLDAERHLGFLDAWIGDEKILSEVRAAFERSDELRRKLGALKRGLRDREQRLDLLRYQVNEIEAVGPIEGETVELEARLSRLKNIERLANAAAVALTSIADGENCASDLTASAMKALEDVSRFDPELETTLQAVREALYNLQDAGHSLRGYVEALEADPEILEQTAGRIDALKRLQRKYGEDEAEILAFLNRAQEELALLEDSESNEEILESAVQVSVQQLLELCSQLSQIRKARAKEFSASVQLQLRELAMDKALFEVDFKSKEPGSDGTDLVEFYFSANSGEPTRPLGKIASGGEISRVMLAIKTALAGKAGVPTLIFDEVDAGLGGRAAATVADKLKQLSRHYQVVVITHLPQIASRADVHYHIEKRERGGRVITEVVLLTDEQRVEEIARMVAGEHLTEAAMTSAREMLARAM